MIAQFKDQIIKFALYVAGFQIGLTLILYILGPEYMAQFWVGILAFLVSIGIVVWGILQTRGSQDGFISFKEAFTIGFLVLFLAGLAGALFNVLLYTVIDPELAVQVKEITIERTVGMMENFGASETEIDEAVQNIQKQDFGLKQQLTGLGWSIPINAILALIIAAFTKKNRPEFFED